MPEFVYDPWMIRHKSLAEVCRFTSEMGYGGIELSPRDDFFPLFAPPAANSQAVAALRSELRAHDIELSSMWTVYRWADADDSEERAQAITFFKKFIEVACELECTHISSEFGGTWQNGQRCREAFMRSMEKIAPSLERTGITLSLDPHPGDCVEDGREAARILEDLDIKNLRLLYSAPHSFYLDAKNDVGAYLREVGSKISFVRVADTFDHRPMARYIVNPLGADVRIHQHLNIGEGEIDWTDVFGGLRAIGYDGCISNSGFAWPDKVTQAAIFMRQRMDELWSSSFD